MTRRHIALIPAAGIGMRFGAGKPKQYVEINGKTVLQHTIAIFEKHPAIDLIAVIVSPEDQTFQTTCNNSLTINSSCGSVSFKLRVSPCTSSGCTPSFSTADASSVIPLKSSADKARCNKAV